MLFPRIYSDSMPPPTPTDRRLRAKPRERYPAMSMTAKSPDGHAIKTMGESLRFFPFLPLNHMYWRYFMWNFALPPRTTSKATAKSITATDFRHTFIRQFRVSATRASPLLRRRRQQSHNVLHMLPLIMASRPRLAGFHLQARHRAVLGHLLPSSS